MKKQILLIGFILGISHNIFSQRVSEFGMAPKWNEGKITLKNTEVIEGLVYYNTSFGTIQFKSNADSEVISMHENRVQGMSFFDKDLKKTRNYYTFHYRDTTTDKEDDLLFEIVKDYKTFGVLSRFTKASLFIPAAYNSNRNILHDFGVPPDKVFSQIEGIFFVDKRAKLELYSVIIDIDYVGVIQDYSKSKSKIIKENLLKNYMSDYWEEISKYMKQFKLKPKMKPDLMLILDHFEQMASKS